MPIAGSIAALTSAGIGIAGAAGAFAPDDPTSPDFAAMTRDAQQATIDLLPDKYRSQATYQPQFARLNRQLQRENLFGTTESTREEQYIDYEPQVQRVPTGEQKYDRELGRVRPVYEEATFYNPVVKTRTVQTQASPGLLQLMSQAAPELDRLSNESRRRTVENDLGIVEQFGPRASAAIRGYDPQTTGLFDMLSQQAQEELAAGRGLTSGERREAEQAVRSAQAARGLGYGPSDAFTEVLTVGNRGTARLRDRQQLASQVAGQRASWLGDPFMQLLQRTSGSQTNPAGFVNMGQNSIGDLSAVPGSAAQYGLAGYEAQQNAARAGYNAQVGSIGSLPSGFNALVRSFSNWPTSGGAPRGTYSSPTSSYSGNFFSGYGY